MALKCTPYLIQTATGGRVRVQTCVDVGRSNSPYIADKNGNVLYTWDVSNKTWMGIEASSAFINKDGFSTTETYGSILTQNNKTFTDNTIKIINDQLKGSPASAETYRNSGAFRPWNQWVSSISPNPPPAPLESGTGTAPAPASGQNPEETPSPPVNPEESTPFDPGNKITLPDSLTVSKGRLSYPKKIKDEQDKVYFQAVKIKSGKPRGSGDVGSLKFGFGEPEYEPINDGPVVMAIQTGISDQNTVEWNLDSLNAIDAATYNLSLSGMNTSADQIGSGIKKTIEEILKTAKSTEGPLQRYLAGLAAGVNNILPRTDNIILNPNLELLFQGPQLRPFTFQFKMTARDDKEAIDIKSIIKYFKYHMAVRKTENDLFLKAPHVFIIRYLKGNIPGHPGINLISNPTETELKKACALTNCSVDYTPLGSYMTYREGTMVSYNLSLQFQEITPVYNTDYEEEPGKSHPIGY